MAQLRARIEQIGGTGTGPSSPSAVVSSGIAAIDAVLPRGGLPCACLHEVVAVAHPDTSYPGTSPSSTAAAGFAAFLAARLSAGVRQEKKGGLIVWCRLGRGLCTPELYGPGLAGFGLDPGRLLVVRGRSETDVLWAMEEGLRSGAAAAVLGELAAPAPIALRRLQLAAEAGGVTGLLLRPLTAQAGAGLATTRWAVAAAPGVVEGRVAPKGIRWQVELQRCRGAAPAAWLLDWCHETHRLGVAAPLRHRPVTTGSAAFDRRQAV